MDPAITGLLFGLGIGVLVGIMLVLGLALEKVKTCDLVLVNGQAAWVERNTIPRIELLDEPKIKRVIVGALKQCIDAHGPITPSLMGSAFKRIYKHLLNFAEGR